MPPPSNLTDDTQMDEPHSGRLLVATTVLSDPNFRRSVVYGLGVLKVSVVHRLCKWGLMKREMYKPLN